MEMDKNRGAYGDDIRESEGVEVFILTFSTDGNQLDSLAADIVQGLVYVGDLVKTHFAFVWFRESLT